MRSGILLLILVVLTLVSFTPDKKLMQVRELYHQAIEKEETALLLDKQLANELSKGPLFTGYAGSVKMVLARYGGLPSTRYTLFTSGKKLLEEAIKQAPSEAELRYLRYGIQINSPSFLGYKSDLDSDRLYLIENVSKLEDTDLKMRIQVFLIVYGNLTPAEREEIK